MSCTLVATTDFAKLPPPRFYPEPRVGDEPPLRLEPPNPDIRGDNGPIRRPKPPRRRGFLEPGLPPPPSISGERPDCARYLERERFVDGCGNIHIILSYPPGTIPDGCPFPVSPSIPLGCR